MCSHFYHGTCITFLTYALYFVSQGEDYYTNESITNTTNYEKSTSDDITAPTFCLLLIGK